MNVGVGVGVVKKKTVKRAELYVLGWRCALYKYLSIMLLYFSIKITFVRPAEDNAGARVW